MTDLPTQTLQDLALNAAPTATARLGVQEVGGVMQGLELGALYALLGVNLGPVITGSGGTLSPGMSLFGSAAGALGATMPALASVPEGDALFRVADADDNAGVNNITITAAAGDMFALPGGSTAASFVINVNSASALIFKRSGAWRVLPHAF